MVKVFALHCIKLQVKLTLGFDIILDKCLSFSSLIRVALRLKIGACVSRYNKGRIWVICLIRGGARTTCLICGRIIATCIWLFLFVWSCDHNYWSCIFVFDHIILIDKRLIYHIAIVFWKLVFIHIWWYFDTWEFSLIREARCYRIIRELKISYRSFNIVYITHIASEDLNTIFRLRWRWICDWKSLSVHVSIIPKRIILGKLVLVFHFKDRDRIDSIPIDQVWSKHASVCYQLHIA